MQRIGVGYTVDILASSCMAHPSGAFEMNKIFLRNDGMLFPDADWNPDPKQGLPNLRGGIHAKVEKLPAKGR